MASFNYPSIAFDAHALNKFSFFLCSAHPSGRCPVLVAGTLTVDAIYRRHITRASRLGTEVSEISESNEADDNVAMSKHFVGSDSLTARGNHEFNRDIWRNAASPPRRTKKLVKKMSARQSELECRSGELSEEGEKVKLPYTALDLSMEQCNAILKRLERRSEAEALRFFERMKCNGKLKKNVTAYCLVLRALCKRDDWDAAEALIQQMRCDSSCEVDFQVFNTLIYMCYKRGLVQLGAKWFHMMLDSGVQPNVATFGMVMSLYQKDWNLEEAEFAFSLMRTSRIKCESAYSAMITIYTRMSLYGQAEKIIQFLRDDGVRLNSENWSVLLNAYSQQGKMDEAELTLASMEEAGFSPNVVAYNTLITGYGKVSNMDAAQHLFHNLRSVGVEPDETTYRSMIEGWGRVDNYREAIGYYEELGKLGFNPSSSNLYTMLNLQARHKDEEGALRTIDDMVMMGCQYSSILSSLLHVYERAGRLDRVPLILRKSFYHHVLADQNSCFALLTAYVKHCLVEDAIQILRDKKWKDLVFEHNLYHLLICSCKELGYLENAVKLYKHMPKANKPNLHIMCTMIDIYTLMGLFNEAENTYLELRASGIALDVVAFSIVVRMYAKAGLLERACSVLEIMDKEKSIVPDIYLLRDMLRIYQKCGELDKLSGMYYKILKSGVTWDQEMYDCVINCCSRALPVDELSRLFDEMLQLGFEPNTNTINVMLNVYGKNKLLKKAAKVFSMARKQGLVDVISYNTMIAAYGQGKDFKSLSSTIQKMEFSGFSVSLIAYNCLLDAYGKDGQLESFRNVLKKMKESRCASDHYTYNIMINVYGEQAWIEEVAEVLMELKKSGLGPDLCSYNTLIKAYGIAGMVEDAVAVIKEMRENGIEPDRVTYMNLVAALRKNDNFLEAVRWSLWMKQIGF